MTGTRRLLAIVTTRSSGRTHILADQQQSIAALAMRAHGRETICGRKIDGRAGEHLAGEYGAASSKDCVQCKLVAEGRGWI